MVGGQKFVPKTLRISKRCLCGSGCKEGEEGEVRQG